MRVYETLDFKRLSDIAIQNLNGVGDIEIGQTSIRGFTSYNSVLELYGNGSLYRFTRAGPNGSYEFKNINIQNHRDINEADDEEAEIKKSGLKP